MSDVLISLTPQQEQTIRSQIRAIISSEIEKISQPDSFSNQRYLNKRQTCLYLNVSNNTLNEWLKLGLPCIRINGAIRFDKKAVDNWLANLENVS